MKTCEFTTAEEQNQLKSLLQTEIVTLTFAKKDGSERIMKCTLNESKIPAEKAPKNSGKAVNSEILPVFDVEKSDWRSFRWDSIKKVEFGLEK